MRGTVDLLILRALQPGPAHGCAVSRWVHERTDSVLALENAALYQALYRLEEKCRLTFALSRHWSAAQAHAAFR